MPELTIRETMGAEECPRLVEIWRSAVGATHGFLAQRDRAEIEERLPAEYLPHVRVSVADVAEVDGGPVGFAGTSEGKLEMLFVDAAHRGRGIGSSLLAHVVHKQDVTYVDVNAQNEQAVGFYMRSGFAVIGRSELDDAGRPYPLLRMTNVDHDSAEHIPNV